MMCAWNELLIILPPKLRQEVACFHQDSLQEIRLRINAPPEFVINGRKKSTGEKLGQETLQYVINAASQYSPWCSHTITHGYLTASGGHRIGLCGEAIVKNGQVSGFSRITSLCIRIAHDIRDIGQEATMVSGSVLILGAPGWGKTTLLRNWTRCLAAHETVYVIDERKELFPEGFSRGERMDVLSGCPKRFGIEMGTRTMSPDWIAVDEITAEEDCMALIHSANCGVRLVATAHARDFHEFENRTVYHSLLENRIFQTFVVLNQNKSYNLERIK